MANKNNIHMLKKLNCPSTLLVFGLNQRPVIKDLSKQQFPGFKRSQLNKLNKLFFICFDKKSLKVLNNFWFDGENKVIHKVKQGNLKIDTDSVQYVLTPAWEKRNIQNKTKYYKSGEYCLAIYTNHMYKYFWLYKDITNNFLIVNLLEIS